MGLKDLQVDRGVEKKHPILFRNEILVVTDREKEFLDALIYTRSIKQAAEKAGLPESAAKEFLHGPRVRDYFEEKIRLVASKNALTLESVLDRIAQVAFGKIKVTKIELEGLRMLSQYLKITSPMQINVGTQVINENPYKDLPDDKLEAMLASRLNSQKQIEVQASGAQ